MTLFVNFHNARDLVVFYIYIYICIYICIFQIGIAVRGNRCKTFLTGSLEKAQRQKLFRSLGLNVLSSLGSHVLILSTMLIFYPYYDGTYFFEGLNDFLTSFFLSKSN